MKKIILILTLISIFLVGCTVEKLPYDAEEPLGARTITGEEPKKFYEGMQTILQNTVDTKMGNVQRTLQLPDIMSKLCLVELEANPEIDDPIIKQYIESEENVNVFMIVRQEYLDNYQDYIGEYASEYVDENGYTAFYVEGLTAENGYKCFDVSAGRVTYTYKSENCKPISPRETECERYYFS